MGKPIDADKLKADLEKVISKNEDMDCLDFLLVACYRTNHPYVGFELDKYYYDLSKKRLDAEMAQMRLSDIMPEVMP